jgi:perosamine synthetase
VSDPGVALTLEKMCVDNHATVSAALELMTTNLMGIAFIVDSDNRLMGCVTDGDIRRLTLEEKLDLSGPISVVMNKSPSALLMSSDSDETYAALSSGLADGKTVFPRLDAAGRIQSFSYRQSWGLVPIAEPSLTGNESAYVLECLASNWISSTGPFVGRFESAFAAYTGLHNPVAVSNGTTAITLALQALGLPPGGEVIVPDCTFAATANAVVAAGGKPVFADVDPVTWGLSPDTVRELIGPNSWGLIPVHLYGNPCDMVGLRALCDNNGLFIVEDCAESIGTILAGEHVGTLADAATFSFFGNKTLTTGEGGMTFFRDGAAKQRALVLRDHGMSKSRKYWHEVVGYNYRMTNLQAAIGLGQTERIKELVLSKLENAAKYSKGLEDIEGISIMPLSPFGTSSYWLVPILIEKHEAGMRDALMSSLAAQGIQSRITFPPLHSMPAFSQFRSAGDSPVSTTIADQGLCLPNNPGMSIDDIRAALDVLADFVSS